MRLSSKGLGKMTLPFDLAEAQIAKGEDGRVWFSGRIKKRAVRWDYRLRLDDADIVRFMALARHSEIVRYVAQRLGTKLYRQLLARALATARGFFARRRPPAAGQSDRERRDGVLVQGAR